MSFNFTRKVDYALVALATLAEPTPKPGENGGQAGKGEARSLSALQIAETQKLPPRVVTNVLKRLHSAGIIKSRRGAGGGYWLARSASEITVAEVLEAVQGAVKIAPCCGANEPHPCQPCQITPHCPIVTSIRRLNLMLVNTLQTVTIADLISQKFGGHEEAALNQAIPGKGASAGLVALGRA